MTRREFLGATASAASLALLHVGRAAETPAAARTARIPPALPRRRGFNLTDLTAGKRRQRVAERDFAAIAEWGFDFVRLPCNYWAWASPKDWLEIDEAGLKPIDEAIGLARQYQLHLCLSLYRLPGYGLSDQKLEPRQLFGGPTDELPLSLGAAAYHWRFLAHRYRQIPPDQLSFDLISQPPAQVDRTRYIEVIRALADSIRTETRDRLVLVGGADAGQTPLPELIDDGVAQSTRGFLPNSVTRVGAPGVEPGSFESSAAPAWPLTDRNGGHWDRERLRERLIAPWQPIVAKGVPVQVGEFGCFNRTPHPVALAWMTDALSLWKEADWGWALASLKGPFGVLDSGRADVAYDTYHGRKLDRRMLELLQTA